MNKFKVGDIITGIPNNGYVYTTENAEMVVDEYEGTYIRVRIIEHSNPKFKYRKGNRYTVDPNRFKLVNTVQLENI